MLKGIVERTSRQVTLLLLVVTYLVWENKLIWLWTWWFRNRWWLLVGGLRGWVLSWLINWSGDERITWSYHRDYWKLLVGKLISCLRSSLAMGQWFYGVGGGGRTCRSDLHEVGKRERRDSGWAGGGGKEWGRRPSRTSANTSFTQVIS